jgi:GTP diphosphokinase / guanosine-3',5'-bis(diphosphate) 3'-diphosphatase
MPSAAIPRLTGTADERFAAVLARVALYAPHADRDLLTRAYAFASEIHDGVLRQSGDPYLFHVLEAAYILADIEMDDATIAAGLLHDTMEDGTLLRADGTRTPITRDDLAGRFGPEVAALVEGVTKLGTIHFPSGAARQAENLRRMLLATARDVRVVLIKLADRLHNMRTLGALDPERRRRIADETLRILAPIAHRLGVWRIKWELEDLAFRVLEPVAYADIQRKVNRTRADREAVVGEAIDLLKTHLETLGITAEVVGRPKHFYSIAAKMKNEDVDFSQIFDLEAIRVIVDSVADCYAVLGEVHSLFPPLNAAFTDYIAMPKPNLYQSLHTKVVGPHGKPLEVQIRTREMHRIAESGIAAHWRYKEGGNRDVQFEEKLHWLRNLLDTASEAKNEEDFLEAVKTDLFRDQVFALTPGGDIMDLPAGSTPVDFAYRVHTDLGARVAGARVNGVIQPLDYQIANGDLVQIITRKTGHPSLDWLQFVVSPHARQKIKQYFRKQNREENILRGRAALEDECRRDGVASADVLKPDKLLEIARKMNLQEVEELYAHIGYGDCSAEGVLHRLREEEPPRRTLEDLRNTSGTQPEQKALPLTINSADISGLALRLSRCCHPIPGDILVGYITRGQGVAVHRVDCPNLRRYREDPEEAQRLLTLDWQGGGEGQYQAELEIVGIDRVGLSADIFAVFAETKANIRSSSLRTDKKKHLAHFTLQVDTPSTTQLQDLIGHLQSLADVIQVHRRRTGT